MRLCHQPNAAIDLHLPAIDILSLFFPFAASVSRSCFQISTSTISQQINTQLLKKKWRRWSLQRILSSYQLETLSNVSLVLPLITLSQSTWSHFVAIFLHTKTGPGFFLVAVWSIIDSDDFSFRDIRFPSPQKVIFYIETDVCTRWIDNDTLKYSHLNWK